MSNIIDIIFSDLEEKKDHIAIIDESGEITFSELYNQVNELATTLSVKGVKPGMGIGVMDRNNGLFISMIFAVLKAGAVAMPISNQLKTQEVEKIYHHSNLHWIIDAGNGPELSIPTIDTIQYEERKWQIFSSNNGAHHFAEHVNDAAIVRYTSGTTGIAKGVIIGHKSIDERISAANKALKLDKTDRVIWVLPMSYHFVVSIILYVKYGSTIIICKDFLGQTIADDIVNHKGTFLYASPMHIKMLCTLKESPDLSSLHTVISTSTAITKSLCDRFSDKFQIPISQAYGIIEIGLPIINFDKAAEHPDAVGKALPDYDVAILDEDFNELSAGEIGNLGIKGPGMFDAYLQPARMRADVLDHKYFMTGDLASKNSDGVIKVEGRKKSMINVSGNKVFPIEVEEILNNHPDIKISRVSGFQHRLMGEMVFAEIVPESGKELDKEAIINYCRKQLTTYKVPQKIAFCEDLPMTDSGKLKR